MGVIKMKNKIKLLLIILVFIGMVISSIAQTSSSSRSSRRSSRGTFRSTDSRGDNREDYRQAIVYDFVRAIIAGKLRHPDPKIRIQAIQTIVGSMVSGEGNDSDTNEGGARDLFSIGNDDSNNDNESSVGAAVYIPDLYTLLSDPNPEVRDTASVALDALFGTDTTLIRLMDDTDPLVRKYATKIYAKRAFSDYNNDNNDRNNENNTNDLKSLIALRTFLVRLKYEKNPEVRKVITDSIEYYLRSEVGRRDNKNREGTGGFIAVDASMYTYLKDPNPEIRKNAVKIISQLDYNPQVLKTLMDMLKTEQDKGVKTAIQKAIDAFIQKEKQLQEGTERIGR